MRLALLSVYSCQALGEKTVFEWEQQHGQAGRCTVMRACVTVSVGAAAAALPLTAKLTGPARSRGAPRSGVGAAAALLAQVIWKLWMYRASKAASQ